MHRAIKIAAIAGPLAATALIASTTAANASATINDDGTGHVDKGDVQALFGWNDATMQTNAGRIKFTNVENNRWDYIYTCNDGTEAHDYLDISTTKPINTTLVTNKQGKVTDWTLTGYGAGTTGYDYKVGAGCESGVQSFDAKLLPATSVVQVNGTTLPNTPAL